MGDNEWRQVHPAKQEAITAMQVSKTCKIRRRDHNAYLNTHHFAATSVGRAASSLAVSARRRGAGNAAELGFSHEPSGTNDSMDGGNLGGVEQLRQLCRQCRWDGDTSGVVTSAIAGSTSDW